MGLVKKHKTDQSRSRTKKEKSKTKSTALDFSLSQRSKSHKVQCSLVPVPKLCTEKSLENSAHKKFHQFVKKMFRKHELFMTIDDEDMTKSGSKIHKLRLEDLCVETAKLKTLRAMDSISPETIIRLLNVLDNIISEGAKVSLAANLEGSNQECKLAVEKVTCAVDASLSVLHILTSPGMHKTVYQEDVIDNVILFTRFQLANTIYPVYDSTYRNCKDKGGSKSSQKTGISKKSMSELYKKLTEVVSILAQLLIVQPLTDTTVLLLSSIATSPFFVEGINELQLSALRLATNIFTKYEKHRSLLLDDIISLLARMSGSRRNHCTYQLESQGRIQMTTVLILDLIQCLGVLPENLIGNKQGDIDSVISSKLMLARRTAHEFLHMWLTKCGRKSDDSVYQLLFENFIRDLLTAHNKPEWSAAGLMLCVLGNLLVASLINKKEGMPLRMMCLDFLGILVARMREDDKQYEHELSTVHQIIRDMKSEEEVDQNKNTKNDVDEELKTQLIQRVLLDYLAVKGQGDPTVLHSRHLYLVLWYQDNCTSCNTSSSKFSKSDKSSKRKQTGTNKENLDDNGEGNGDIEGTMRMNNVAETRKKFLLSKVGLFKNCTVKEGLNSEVPHACFDYNSAEHLLKYLSSKRPFSKSFSIFLKHILGVLMESSVLLRAKAMKCLSALVEVDKEVLALQTVQAAINHSFLDHSASVREAAVDLVGKFVLTQPSLLVKYYEMLSGRILDTGINVRKKVIKIMKDVCIQHPNFSKTSDIYVKIIRRLNDEEVSVCKLVLEVFRTLWFTPASEEEVAGRTANITGVVAVLEDLGLELFEQLVVHLLKPNDEKADRQELKTTLTACKQIVDFLVDNELNQDTGSSQRVIVCLRTLYIFSKVQPQLLVGHIDKIQSYLSINHEDQVEHQMVSWVVRMLETVVPLIDQPSEEFLTNLEQHMVNLMMQHDQTVIYSCASCLGLVVNTLTHNYEIVRNCFNTYNGYLLCYKKLVLNGQKEGIERYHPIIKRSLYVVGMLMRFFDFTNKEVQGPFPDSTRDVAVDLLLFYLQFKELQCFTLKAIGSICIQYCQLMMTPKLKTAYLEILGDSSPSLELKIQVLSNIEQYLQEEDGRIIKQDLKWEKLSKQENLKEMGDVSAGMASTVVQLYIKEVLEAYFCPNMSVRQAVLRVVQLILLQGLVHPVQIVPYLICMTTDKESTVCTNADKRLEEIERKYPGFVHMQAQRGVSLSYRLQEILQAQGSSNVARGYRNKDEGQPVALNGSLYSILHSKQQRRAFILSIFKRFEELKVDLVEMLFLADNMAYFPYQTQEEPLFIIHQINLMISVTGTNLLQSFLEALLPKVTTDQAEEPTTGPASQEEEEEDIEELLARVPDDTTFLYECLVASRGCMLLLLLKQHLKNLYNINDNQISQYSPSDTAKSFDKAVQRKKHSRFNPNMTLEKLKQATPQDIDETVKRSILLEFLEFKNLIMNLDLDDSKENDNENVISNMEVKSSISSMAAKEISEDTSLNVPIQREQKISKSVNKKHSSHHKSECKRKPRMNKNRKRKRAILTSSDDDSSDNSD